jgi:hypothetical protein
VSGRRFDGPFGPELPVGDYLGDVSREGRLCETNGPYDGIAFTDRLLHLAAGSSGTLRIVLAADGATVTSKVCYAEGNPVPGAAVIPIAGRITTPAQLSTAIQYVATDRDGSAKSADGRPAGTGCSR